MVLFIVGADDNQSLYPERGRARSSSQIREAWSSLSRRAHNAPLLAVPEHDRRDQQNIVVDKILSQERLDERGATPAIGGADAISKTLHVPREVTTTIASYLPRGRSHSLGRRTSSASRGSVSSRVGALNRG